MTLKKDEHIEKSAAAEAKFFQWFRFFSASQWFNSAYEDAVKV